MNVYVFKSFFFIALVSQEGSDCCILTVLFGMSFLAIFEISFLTFCAYMSMVLFFSVSQFVIYFKGVIWRVLI